MTDQPRAFLPAGALTDDRVRQALAEALDGWSRAWFVSARADLSLASAGKLSVADEQADGFGQHARLAPSGAGKRRLIEAALGEGLEGKVLSAADRQALDAFYARLALDLVERIDRLLGREAGPQMRLEVTLGGRPIAALGVNRGAVVALVRRALPARSLDGAFPASRADAVAQLPVRVEAVLGRALLTIEDAKGLAVGDVIVLDRPLNENAQIRIDPGRALVAEGRLVPDPDGNRLIIDTPGKGLNRT